MTVEIRAPQPGGTSMEEVAKGIVRRELKAIGKTSYCEVKRDLAAKALADYQTAYLQVTDGDDQWAGVAVTWACGGLLGTSLDPKRPMYGLRAVLDWVEDTGGKSPEEFDRWMRHVVKALKPINAMAQLDMELLRQERGLSMEDVNNG